MRGGAKWRYRCGPAERCADRPRDFLLLKKKLLNSWDRFLIPVPFGRGWFLYGRPIRVDRHASEAEQEAARLLLESELRRLTAAADAMADRKGVP